MDSKESETIQSPVVTADRPAVRSSRSPALGLTIEPTFCPADVAEPFDTVAVGNADCRHQGRRRRGSLRAEGLRSSRVLEPIGDERRRQQVFLRRERHVGTGAERAAACPPRQPHDRRLGPARRLFRLGRRRREFLPRPVVAVHSSVRLVQFAGLVQCRPVPPVRHQGRHVQLALGRQAEQGRSAGEPLRVPPGLGLFHPERPGQHGRHHGTRPQRGHVVQVRLGHRHRSEHAAFASREAFGRRQAVGAAVVHAGLRPDCRGRQERRQDPPGGQDAVDQGLAPGRHGVRRVQEPRGEEGPHADPGRRLPGRPRPTIRSSSRTRTSRSA